MATHSSILAWTVPWTEEPGKLQSMGSQIETQLSTHTSACNSWQEAAKTTPSGDRLYFCSGVPCNWAAGRGFSSTSQIPSWHSDMGASDMRSKGWRVCSQWRSDGLPVGGTDSLTLPNRSRAAASHGCGLATFPVSGGPGAGWGPL